MHYAKYMIDLTFVNILFVKNRVHHNLNSGLDYFTIIITIPNNNIISDWYIGYKIKKDQFKCFANLIEEKTVLLFNTNILNIVNKINIAATKLNIFLQITIKDTKAWNTVKSRIAF